MNTFLLICSIVGGVATLTTAICKVYFTISNLEKKINTWENNLQQNTLYIMKLALYSSELSITDRIQAGQNYLMLRDDKIIEKKSMN